MQPLILRTLKYRKWKNLLNQIGTKLSGKFKFQVFDEHKCRLEYTVL